MRKKMTTIIDKGEVRCIIQYNTRKYYIFTLTVVQCPFINGKGDSKTMAILQTPTSANQIHLAFRGGCSGNKEMVQGAAAVF